MKTKIYFLIYLAALLMLSNIILAQGVAINEDDSEADPSAILDVKSNNKGLLIPRMIQSEIEAISNPANGLIVFSTTDEKFYAYISMENIWKAIAFSPPPWACGDLLKDSRDAQTYNTVQIGTQCWMAENLNVGIMISSSVQQTNNSTIEKHCYDNSTANCETYGGLYYWDEMMEYSTTLGAQGICPTGWHIPTNEEWKTMEMQLGMTQAQADATGLRGTDEGGKLKEIGTTHWNSPNTGATNSSGFTSLPGGYHYISGIFESIGTASYFWDSNSIGSDASRRSIGFDSQQIYQSYIPKQWGLNIRCLKD